jgi:hypothetical protein
MMHNERSHRQIALAVVNGLVDKLKYRNVDMKFSVNPIFEEDDYKEVRVIIYAGDKKNGIKTVYNINDHISVLNVSEMICKAKHCVDIMKR